MKTRNKQYNKFSSGKIGKTMVVPHPIEKVYILVSLEFELGIV